jgi:hypothetical protein
MIYFTNILLLEQNNFFFIRKLFIKKFIYFTFKDLIVHLYAIIVDQSKISFYLALFYK